MDDSLIQQLTRTDIHVAPPGVNGSIIIWLCQVWVLVILPGFPLSGTVHLAEVVGSTISARGERRLWQ